MKNIIMKTMLIKIEVNLKYVTKLEFLTCCKIIAWNLRISISFTFSFICLSSVIDEY